MTLLNAATTAPPVEARSVVAFWRDAGPRMWFAKDAHFDQRFRDCFLIAHDAAARRLLDAWLSSAEGALALMILLDQFPRNAFRGTPRMYATDALAREFADGALAAGYDRAVTQDLRVFFYLPFGHSETLADQDRSVRLAGQLPDPHPSRARHHREIVRRFGRFPHRNPILGRVSTAEEQQYMDGGGYVG